MGPIETWAPVYMGPATAPLPSVKELTLPVNFRGTPIVPIDGLSVLLPKAIDTFPVSLAS